LFRQYISSTDYVDKNTISDLHAAGTLLTTDVCNPDHGSHSTRSDAENEFRSFVLETYNELYQIESRVLGGISSIGVFCRLDIGLIISPQQQVHYFVNEVERVQTTSLWSNKQLKEKSSQARIGILGETFAEAFYNWLSHTINPHPV
jgi:hypothetical protein